jgi:hypothetical protein
MTRQTSIQLTEATERQANALRARGFGTFTDVVRLAIDRMYREETEMETMQIRVEFSEDGLFGGWEDMEYYDIEASRAAYRDELETALEEAFPGAEIEVVTGINDRVEVNGQRDTNEVADAREIVADTYQSYGWVRYTEAGIRVALPEGLWLERPQDGVIISVEEINCEEYEISFHKGELPAHESIYCTTLDEAMTVMQRTHTGDWSDWRPRTA